MLYETLLIYKEETYVIMIACDIALYMKGNICCYNSMCHCLIQGRNLYDFMFIRDTIWV